MDLLRDINLNSDLALREPHTKWQCNHCKNKLDFLEIENRLIQEAERLSLRFLSQDFRCPKTQQVSIRLNASTSGSWVLALSIYPNYLSYELLKF